MNDTVRIEINGIPLEASRGEMIISVADRNGIVIPRFCYHEKLSIAANCRMCLVEVEKVGKPLPACATPVAEGMKVFTASPRALSAQRAVVEFLLINHPLDCPVCDQGGECPLQDQAMGFGSGVSRFFEGKRAVKDKYIGPLIATAMTRCIHCTRCIRFLDEIAGVHELGAVGRGEHMEITNFVEQSLTSELSGNIIDLCPVGALLAKPSLNTARPWELIAHPSIAPHDAVGSNVYIHTRRGEVVRVVPREHSAINDIWLSDRDRFSFEGLRSEERLTAPKIKRGGVWETVDWEEALTFTAERLKGLSGDVGGLIAPWATLEEMFLFQRLVRGLGSPHVDHRLRQGDFSDDPATPLYPWLGQRLLDLETLDACLLIGCDIRMEQPLAAYRLRRAALTGAKVMSLGGRVYSFHFPVEICLSASPAGQIRHLAGIAKALGADLPIRPLASHRRIASMLEGGERTAVLLGLEAELHPQGSMLRALAQAIAEASGSHLGYLPQGNGVGGWIAGAVPHRLPGGEAVETPGLPARTMLEAELKGYVLFGVEPERDAWDGAQAVRALSQAEFVLSMASFTTPAMEAYAEVLLPIAAFAETSGTFINMEGVWQGFEGAVPPPGEARPGWKVLRALGTLLGFSDMAYTSSREVSSELEGFEMASDNRSSHPLPRPLPKESPLFTRLSKVPMVASDPLVRRAKALRETPYGSPAVYIHESTAASLGILGHPKVMVEQGNEERHLPLVIDDGIPEACALIPLGFEETAGLGPAIGPVRLEGVAKMERPKTPRHRKGRKR